MAFAKTDVRSKNGDDEKAEVVVETKIRHVACSTTTSDGENRTSNNDGD